MESSCDNRADIFCQKFIVINFLKGSAHFLREKTKFLSFFQKKNNLVVKVPLDRKKCNFTVGWRFIAKVWQFYAQELKKNSETFLFSKKKKRPSKHSFGHREAFSIIIPKNDKKNSAENLNRISHWIFFRENMCFHKGPYGSAESIFDNFADISLPNFDFVVKNLEKTALDSGEKLLNSFPEKNFHIEKLL